MDGDDGLFPCMSEAVTIATPIVTVVVTAIGHTQPRRRGPNPPARNRVYASGRWID